MFLLRLGFSPNNVVLEIDTRQISVISELRVES